ncbi:MAG: sulfotransferase [Saprospiraceae bacterium]|nr:sulfotransferase [Saprospiraceae bacterium]
MSKRIIVHQYWFCNPFSWIKLLIDNKGVHYKFIWKAVLITLLSLVSYPIQILNSLALWWKGRHLKMNDEPVFIVGHWRGGTTFLHYILAQDEQFGYLTYYHAFVPNLAIIGDKLVKKILARVTPDKRPQDDIRIGMDLPTEEENPLSTYSSHSASHSFFFPKNERYFQKYVLFEGINDKEKSKWQKAYLSILNRISVHQKGRQLLIKNPHNTGRVRELLELFPRAKFIHIYRNPYEIFSSTFRMYDMVVKTQFLQEYSKDDIEQKILYYYNSVMGRYFKDKSLIPDGQLIEIKFEEFEKDPLSSMHRIYKQLNLDMTDATLSRMRSYVEGLKDYSKNVHEVPDQLKAQIEADWAFGFRELGYQMN